MNVGFRLTPHEKGRGSVLHSRNPSRYPFPWSKASTTTTAIATSTTTTGSRSSTRMIRMPFERRKIAALQRIVSTTHGCLSRTAHMLTLNIIQIVADTGTHIHHRATTGVVAVLLLTALKEQFRGIGFEFLPHHGTSRRIWILASSTTTRSSSCTIISIGTIRWFAVAVAIVVF